MKATICMGVLVAAASLITGAEVSHAVEVTDGKRFDTGATMTYPADGAPPETKELIGILGTWEVEFERYDDEGETASIATGISEITFMNRGHGFMERFHCDNFDGNDNILDTVSFLMYNKGAKNWNFGVANSFTENITIYNGRVDERGQLLAETIIRRGGGAKLWHDQLILSIKSDEMIAVLSRGSTVGTHR